MPKWVFYHTKGAFTREDKEKLAQGMSNIYTTFGLPAFYCHVHFFERSEDDIWTGGKPSENFVNINLFHAAANIINKEEGEQLLKAFDDVVRPVLKARGLHWESNIYETPRFAWRINGMAPPYFDTEMHKKWLKDNKFTDEEEEQILRDQGYLDASRWKLPTFNMRLDAEA